MLTCTFAYVGRDSDGATVFVSPSIFGGWLWSYRGLSGEIGSEIAADLQAAVKIAERRARAADDASMVFASLGQGAPRMAW